VVRAVGVLAGVCLLAVGPVAACSSSPAKPVAEAKKPVAEAKGITPSASSGVRSPGATATAHPVTPPPPVPKVVVSKVRTADGSVVTVAAFRGPVRYVLHNGSEDPGGAAAGLVKAGPAITGAEQHRLLAAFNGGFKLSAGAGGYEQEDHVISPLTDGLASLVIDRSGRARIGIWGRGVPAAGEAVYSVRQNLQPLVLRGHPTQAAYDWGLWGATLGGGEYVARSAIGETSSGTLLFAGSMSTTPQDLADALVRRGARIAMELDINPEWVQLAVARVPGGPLAVGIPGQVRPARQYLIGWTRDFITVLAPPGT
jgi:hypothetical protein